MKIRSTGVFAFVALLLAAAVAPAADDAAAFSSKEEFGAFMQGYYKDPRPERVESAMRFVAGSDLMTAENTARMMQTSFSCLFARHPEKRDAWKKAIATLPEPARTYFQVAMESDPVNMFLDTPTAPEKNDMSWGCFFITGDVGYVRLHGRNEKTWWGRGDGDRYDYNYSPEELKEWVRKIRELAEKANTVYVFFNNCHAGQAARNALLMRDMMQQDLMAGVR